MGCIVSKLFLDFYIFFIFTRPLTRVVYFNGPATGYEWGAPMNASRAGGHGWAPMNSHSMCGGR